MKLIHVDTNGVYQLKAENIEDSEVLQGFVNEQKYFRVSVVLIGADYAINKIKHIQIEAEEINETPNLMTNENNPEDVWCATCRKWITRTAIGMHNCDTL